MGPNTANNWNFAPTKGLDFNTGYPVVVPSADHTYGGSTISDTLGNLLFYVTGDGNVYNRNHLLMENGDLINSAASEIKQNILIIPAPGSQIRYYIFTVGNEYDPIGLYYHIVDMSKNGGLGSVIVRDVKLDAGTWAQSRLNAVRHSNKTDFWVIARIVFDSRYTAFRVSQTGVDQVPVVSPARYTNAIEIRNGEMKMSPDSRTLVSLEWHYNLIYEQLITISDFDASTGVISERFAIETNVGSDGSDHAEAAEFSPDSKFLYVGFESNEDPFGSLIDKIWQYDMTMTDSLTFSESGTHIKTLNNKWFRDIQLAPDGKIYIVQHENVPLGLDSLDVINKPWKKGPACEYVPNIIGLQTIFAGSTFEPFPNFIQEQLFRFVYKGSCAKAPFTFRHRFIPEPDSIVWNFGDGTTSTVFNPTHVFQSGGNYEVHAHVVYPDGRVEETSRVVEVLAAPEPWLGNDTLMCEGSSIQLDAGAGFNQYVWNGQFPPGNQFYTATDTGYYSVRVMNELNCYGSDTIHVALYPKVYIDVSEVEISNTTCNNSTGAIRGIQVSSAITVEWRNGSGTVVGTSIDIQGLPVGNYILSVTDTTGCVTELPPFTINNINSELIIQSAEPVDARCDEVNGSIEVTTSVFSDLLMFSKDNGITWENNSGYFSNLSAGEYWIMVKDAEGCDAVYVNNPVFVNDVGGPEVTYSGFTPASGTNANGTITVLASGDSLYYQLNGGVAQDTGYFEGLASDVYVITITDKYGCDTTLTVTVTSETGYQLSALAGNDRQCLHKMATSELRVTNLNGVKDFKATVIFNSMLLDCIGYDELFDPALVVTEFPNRIELEWHGASPLAITDTVTLAHLVFETRETGLADIQWDIPGDSYFKDENCNNIPCNPIDGGVSISDPPILVTNGDKRLCEGGMHAISADAFLGVPPYDLEWALPDGSTTDETPIWILGADQLNAGEYIVTIKDQYNCIVKDTVRLEVISPPATNFPETPIPFENEYRLEAPQGYASYEWSSGDSIYYITVTEEGEYSVIIQTEEGCESRDTAMMVNVAVPIQIPNAFTPNGDG